MQDLSYLRTEQARNYMIESYDIEYRDKENKLSGGTAEGKIKQGLGESVLNPQNAAAAEKE